MMIDRQRLASLRDRFADLRSQYARSADEARSIATEVGRERVLLLAAYAGTIAAERKRKHLPEIKVEQMVADPNFHRQVAETSEDELEAAGVPADQIRALKAREMHAARRRKDHEQLGQRVREMAALMENVERVAKENNA